ncbi:dual specificity protein kinase CLK1 [Folsomia candida]|uniref:dual specificity protein kinase CLK1 n=1 Tax=Folsomia candida TaxID=158441 RepID=UPI001604DA93|nr:dual specificity protein kinase CLK1 [Folsomia candida]
MPPFPTSALRSPLPIDYGPEDEDEHGHLRLKPSSVLCNRYKVLTQINSGTFGQVWSVIDLWSSEGLRYAMKVPFRKDRRDDMPDQQLQGSKKELAILRELNMLNKFQNEGLRMNNFRPFSNEQAIHISKQLLDAVRFVHSLNILHADIKPSNIAFVHGDYVEMPVNDTNVEFGGKTQPQNSAYKVLIQTQIRLVDFGAARNLRDSYTPTEGKVGTREYRPPESILQLTFDTLADIWSVGCTLFDVWIGSTLFEGVQNGNQCLHRMEYELGPMSTRYLETLSEEFMAERRLVEDESGSHHREPSSSLLIAFKLIEKMLQYEARSRPTAKQALNDCLFQHSQNNKVT